MRLCSSTCSYQFLLEVLPSSDFQLEFLRTQLSSKPELISTIAWCICPSKSNNFLHWLCPGTLFNSCDLYKEKEIWDTVTEQFFLNLSKGMDFTIKKFLFPLQLFRPQMNRNLMSLNQYDFTLKIYFSHPKNE